jgi:hypothetical protein
MKVTIELDIKNEDEEMQLRRMLKATDLASVLHEIMYNIEKKARWECESLEADSDPSDGVYVYRRLIGELLDKRGIIIDDLIE